jgi:hypothetical protein
MNGQLLTYDQVLELKGPSKKTKEEPTRKSKQDAKQDATQTKTKKSP